MKICVYGAGAIGGLLGAYLARAGEDVTLIARGPKARGATRPELRVVAGLQPLSHVEQAGRRMCEFWQHVVGAQHLCQRRRAEVALQCGDLRR